METRSHFISLCLAGGGAVALVALLAFQRQPEVDVANAVFDYGVAYEGTVIKHSFIITNIGRGVLTIDQVVSECGCIAAEPLSRKLDRGEQAAIDVRAETRFFRGSSRWGVTVQTNDPKRRAIYLQIQADVIPEFDLSPPYIDFGAITDVADRDKAVTIRVAAERNLAISSAVSTDERVTTTIQGSRDGSVKVLSSIQAAASGAPIHGNLIVTTSSGLTPIIRIPIRATFTRR